MQGDGILELVLTDVRGQPIEDRVGVRIFRGDSRLVLDRRDIQFKPPHGAVRIKGLPTVPDALELHGRVTPTRYHGVRIPPFRLVSGQKKQIALVLPREPRKWKADFTGWKSLPPSFATFRKVLDRSQGLRLKGPERAVVTFNDFKGSRDYDVVDGDSQAARVLAKAALLNIHHKMSALRDPTANGAPWFHYVRRIIEVRRDRMIAEVDPELADSVLTIHENIGQFAAYERTHAANHHVNMPIDLFEAIPEESMLSIKSSESEGNLQLTFARATLKNEKFVLLDADIDEKGTFFGHVFEVVNHTLTGSKTHPFDVHELLLRQNIRAKLGYGLVPR